mmetsp:Transcript_4403/g.8831  ORF Transcript_4403/g.8831 Transcript_4403/m.8831 type:complete len:199 (-) Transcript_4403:107-703(-)
MASLAMRPRRLPNHRVARLLLGLVAISLALTTIRCCTFTQPQMVPSAAATATSRRDMLLRTSGLVAAPMIASATLFSDAAKAAPRWSGKYNDPKHPGCERRISKDNFSGEYTIAGASSRDKAQKGCDVNDPRSQKRWALTGVLIAEDTLSVDFSSKGGPKDVQVKLVKDSIEFPDGNKWKKIPNPPGTTGKIEYDVGR